MIDIYLYTDHPSSSLNIDKLKSFLESFNFRVEDRGDFFTYLTPGNQDINDFNLFLESIKIEDIETPIEFPASGEKKHGPSDAQVRENFFDGLWLQRKLYSFLNKSLGESAERSGLHLILTGKLFGTFETRRYHARVILTGVPALISTSGVVEAPARPREYYYAKSRLLAMGKGLSELDEIFKEKFIEYDDPKITNIICSYALQQVKAFITGEPFCDDKECCLLNSHWQEEVLKLQYNNVVCENCRKELV